MNEKKIIYRILKSSFLKPSYFHKPEGNVQKCIILITNILLQKESVPGGTELQKYVPMKNITFTPFRFHLSMSTSLL